MANLVQWMDTSTPTLKGMDTISFLYSKAQQRKKYTVKCHYNAD